jgi:hypothetical protein
VTIECGKMSSVRAGGRNNQPLAEMSSGLRFFWSINTARPNKRVGES